MRKRSHVVVASVRGVLLAFSLAGCGVKTPPPPVGPLSCVLAAPDTAATGDSLRLTLTMTNTAEAMLEVEIAAAPAFRMRAVDAAGDEVWESTGGEAVQEVMEIRTLDPGESLIASAVWALRDTAGRPLPAGTYHVEGAFALNPPHTCGAEKVRVIVR